MESDRLRLTEVISDISLTREKMIAQALTPSSMRTDASPWQPGSSPAQVTDNWEGWAVSRAEDIEQLYRNPARYNDLLDKTRPFEHTPEPRGRFFSDWTHQLAREHRFMQGTHANMRYRVAFVAARLAFDEYNE